MRSPSDNRHRRAVGQRRLDRETLSALTSKNAEDLMMDLCRKGYERAYNPNALISTAAPRLDNGVRHGPTQEIVVLAQDIQERIEGR